MSTSSGQISYTIFFAYTKPENYSGQTAASELLIDLFSKDSVKCVPLVLYPFEKRCNNYLSSFIKVFLKQLTIISNLKELLLTKKVILHLNLGQSFWSFLRIGAWYFPIRVFKRNLHTIISLHGSLFMSWREYSLVMALFKFILRTCNFVTVLGERQKERLSDIGIQPKKIKIVPNACSLSPISEAFIIQKHSDLHSVNLLYLSLLIRSKGYITYLNALEALSKMKLTLRVNAVLCGPVTFQANSESFGSEEDKIAWIASRIKSINNHSPLLRVEWIPGASGELKAELFKNAHIFVLPTKFPVEAQPIVLIEALASGCSIITSRAGEIPYTLINGSAVLLDDPNELNLTKEIHALISDSNRRVALCKEGLRLIEGPLSVDSHKITWRKIFSELVSS